MEHRIYCGGKFCFDYRDEGYEAMAAEDFRSDLLNGVEKLLIPNEEFIVRINRNVKYIGPFYFETESLKAEDVVRCEMRMIESCTDAIFLLNDADCPGTVVEMMYANSLLKPLHVFYVRHTNNEETESDLHMPCWYPVKFCQLTNTNVWLHPCDNAKEAANRIRSLVNSLE